jgi:hypothetical protein
MLKVFWHAVSWLSGVLLTLTTVLYVSSPHDSGVRRVAGLMAAVFGSLTIVAFLVRRERDKVEGLHVLQREISDQQGNDAHDADD